MLLQIRSRRGDEDPEGWILSTGLTGSGTIESERLAGRKRFGQIILRPPGDALGLNPKRCAWWMSDYPTKPPSTVVGRWRRDARQIYLS